MCHSPKLRDLLSIVNIDVWSQRVIRAQFAARQSLRAWRHRMMTPRDVRGSLTRPHDPDSLRINIVTVPSGWILQRIAEQIGDALRSVGVDVRVTLEPSENCDANFYVDLTNCFRNKTSRLDIGLFTHLHEDSVRSLQPNWLQCDFIIHMCQRYYLAFSGVYPPERMMVIYPWQIDGAFAKRRKVTIGVVQRGQYEGKGFFFMLGLLNGASPMLRDWLHFLFVGKGWDAVVERYRELGIEVTYVKRESSHLYYECYQKMDYLLIPSLWEGGPMSLMQAYSQSVPVIAADVGWVPDLFAGEPWMMFPPGDGKALLNILGKICSEFAVRRAVAEKFSYSDYASRLLSIVEELRKTQR